MASSYSCCSQVTKSNKLSHEDLRDKLNAKITYLMAAVSSDALGVPPEFLDNIEYLEAQMKIR